MSGAASFARDWLPPVVRKAAGRLRGGGIRFEGGYARWQEAAARCTGYDDKAILDKVLDATLQVKRGEAAYERDSVAFRTADCNWPVAAGLLWAAARCGGRLSVLDFGGALGSSYYQNRGLLQGLPSLAWNVVEQAHFVAAGRAHVQDEVLRFHVTIASCAAGTRPNAVLLSSVLQYLENPQAVLGEVARLGAEVIVIDRTIVNDGAEDRIYVQSVPASIYSATYPCRSLSEQGLLAALGPDYRLASSFTSLEFPALETISSFFKGYVLQKVPA